MNREAGFSLGKRNPDVLTCIANLSNDEVFTPPNLANRMLDTLEDAWARTHASENIWSQPDVKFLDPFTKSGVFLREITKRLVAGLEDLFPNIEERVDHILCNQVYGIGVTQLTALLSRRSLYCSKYANGPHSIGTSFQDASGNIYFDRIEHTWERQRCIFCGASREGFDRSSDLEGHAYPFIHMADPQAGLAEIFGADVNFDVIIGNPPYQLADGGQGASAIPIYNKFVDQAKALEPRLLSMVIPARWFFGGRGLDSFRKSMLADRHIRKLVDFPDSRQAFDAVDVAGGICYFLWNRDEEGDCEVVSHDLQGGASTNVRPLMEPGADVFIRRNESLPILRKIASFEGSAESIALPEEVRFEAQVSGQKPFGLRTYFRGESAQRRSDDLVVLQAGGRAWVARDSITEGLAFVDKWKVFTSKSSSEHAGQADKQGMRRVLSLSGVLPPGSVVTETYVLLGVFETEREALNCLSYAQTKFFRFLVATRTSAQDLPRSAYSFVPIQDYSKPWTDKELYSRYGLDSSEVELIESLIRPMELDNA